MAEWISVKNGLPSGYTELEYIESSGTQYVDTGVVPNNKGECTILIRTGSKRR